MSGMLIDVATRCRTCQHELPPRAKRCLKCDSFQDWRRFFSMGSVVLSLLIALFSVLGTILPVVVSIFTPARSDVLFSLHSVTTNRVVVVSTNQGSRPAIIQNAVFRVFDSHGSEQSVLNLKLPEETEELVVLPGSLRIIPSVPTVSGVAAALPLLPENYRCVVEFSVIAFDHKPKVAPIPVPCPA